MVMPMQLWVSPHFRDRTQVKGRRGEKTEKEAIKVFKNGGEPKGGGDGAERSFSSSRVDGDEGRSECVIALQGSFEKQHLRASVVP